MLLIPIVTGPLKFVDPVADKDPVNAVDPVTIKDPVSINVSVLRLNNAPALPDIVSEPVIVVEPITFNDPVILALPVYGNAAPPPGAYEALNACVAYEAVPCNEPVKPP